ncbi:MAG: S8 family serine peptidase [Myxococcota bacterium]
MSRLFVFAALLAALPQFASAAPKLGPYYDYLSRDVIGAGEFTSKNASWDGRGVVIAVLDTGVDPSVPGMRTTSTGEIKVIEARDFSGEGDVSLTRVERTVEDGIGLLRSDDGVVRGVDGLAQKPKDGVYWVGFFDESSLERSSVNDVNQNGKATDTFAVVAFYPTPGAAPLVALDLDGDGEISDEVVRPDFKVDRQHFSFSHPDPRKDQTPIAFSVTIMPDSDRRVELHFDDGGHGTHCAGIAAGYEIQGKPGFDGIAPGAWVMSLKIGNNALAGGATTPGSMKRAMDYAARWSREHNVPVVMNVSYGIGSEIEGYAGIDGELDELLAQNPQLVASVAAGNEGPGLSTVGTPGASLLAWTAGAYLDPVNGRTLWGAGGKGARIFGFSSRGGELDKPDGLSPGVAWASVPPFHRRAVMAGTSMAAPQASGAHALLISAAVATKTPWNSGLLKAALRGTARPVKGYARVDQGAGLIHVGDAFKALRKDAASAQSDILLAWRISTPVPHRPGSTGTASYWRTGHYVPEDPDTIHFTINPVLFETVKESQKNAFFGDLELDTDTSWIKLDRSRIGVRGEGSAHLSARLKAKAVKRPGLHEGLITATMRGSKLPAFDIPVVIVTPHRFDDAKHRTQSWKGSLAPGAITRRFIEVPPGATAMMIDMEVPEGKFGRVYLNLYDPEGRSHDSAMRVANSETGAKSRTVVSGDELTPGVWEIAPYATFRNQTPSSFKLQARFAGIDLPKAVDYFVPDGGGVEASLTVTNRFERPVKGDIDAHVLGWTREEHYDVEGPKYDTDVVLPAGASGATLAFELTADDYNLFTDIAVNIVDSKGNVVAQSGFGARLLDMNFSGGPGTYSIEILGATAVPDTEPTWGITLRETQRLARPITLAVTGPDGGNPTLYPGVTVALDASTSKALPERPDGFDAMVEFVFEDRLHSGPAVSYRLPFMRQ